MPAVKASLAVSSGSPPPTSNMILPGFTTATQNSTFPLPLPIRVSAALFVTGLSGNMRIQTFPRLFNARTIARREASI